MHGQGFAQQQGMALVLSLIFLAIVTILSLSSMQGAITQDRMASSQRDHTVAFQAAEAALRDAESQLQNGVSPSNSWTTHTISVGQATLRPRYRIIEMAPLGSRSDNSGEEVIERLYLIEAQGFGNADGTSVTLESMFVRQQLVEAP
ncbi:pilus assembly PilX family protein [Vreelandella olivaria]|uniref:pilus assembly PilX family protein n=1 Tax=Vreelandella olivaria TaxID=390919 RepID=UPI00201EF4DD|nr:PilX N-terminal domain-containing pilus assembly protein [Halomonas olivaria]